MRKQALPSTNGSSHEVYTTSHDRIEHLLATAEALHPAEAVEHAEKALTMAITLNDRAELARCLHRVGSCYVLLSRLSEAYDRLLRSFTLFEELDEHTRRSEVARALGDIDLSNGNFHAAIKWYNKGLEISTEAGDGTGTCLSYRALGYLYASIGDHLKALGFYQLYLQTAEVNSDLLATGIARSDIATVHAQVGDHTTALEFFRSSRRSFHDSGDLLLEVRALVNIASSYCACAMVDEALESATRALAIYGLLDDPRGLCRLLMLLGSIYENLGRLDVALDNQLKALDALDSTGDDEAQAHVMLSVGSLYLKNGNHHDAAFVLEQALRVAEAKGNSSLLYQLHHLLSAAAKQCGDTSRALRHHELFASIREDVRGEEMQRVVAEIHTRFEVARVEQQNETLRLKNDSLLLQMEQKQHELRSAALSLVERNQYIDSLRLELAEIERSGESGEPKLQKLIKRVKASSRAKEDWKTFERQFGQVHHDFIRLLLERFPTLTPTEQKVCALLKTGLATKEIAVLLHVSTHNIEMHRYRLRKKLGLSTEANLQTVLASL